MKKTFLKSLAGIAAVAFAVSCTAPAPKYKTAIDFAHVAKPGYWLSILFLSVTGVNPSIGISIANGYAPLRSI